MKARVVHTSILVVVSYLCISQDAIANASIGDLREMARVVYERISAVAGVPHAAPDLEFISCTAGCHGALFDPAKDPMRIVLEDRALEVCGSFGPDATRALAFILGHEMAHYTLSHNWGRDFRMSMGHDRGVAKNLATVEDNMQAYHFFEIQADQRGAFYAELAGFSIDHVVDSVVNRLYRAYGWGSKMSGYPALDERIALLHLGLTNYKELSVLHRLANYRLLLGHHQEALRLYRTLLGEGVRNPMLLTNAAVCCFMLARPLADKERAVLHYPIAMDLRNNWRSTSDAQFDELTGQCEGLLLDALRLDPTSAVIMGDLACLFLLRGDLEEADHWRAKRSRTVGSDDAVGSLLSAIRMYVAGEKDAAADRFGSSELRMDPVAKMNLAVLKGMDNTPNPTAGDASTAEGFGGKTLAELTSSGNNLNRMNFPGQFEAWFAERNNSWVLGAERPLEGGRTEILWLAGVDEGFQGATNSGLRRGDDRTKAMKFYGEPEMTMKTDQGEVDWYPNQRLFIQYDFNRRVNTWTLCMRSQRNTP